MQREVKPKLTLYTELESGNPGPKQVVHLHPGEGLEKVCKSSVDADKLIINKINVCFFFFFALLKFYCNFSSAFCVYSCGYCTNLSKMSDKKLIMQG